MNAVFKVFVLGFFLIASNPLFSIDHTKDLKKGEDKYKRHLENTVWIVPPSTLMAYEYLNGNQVPVSDQTVWVINQFNQGYFFGDSYTALNGTASSHRKIVGSVTPGGNVYIAFYPLSNDTQNTDIVNGIGTFGKQKRKYVFVMQMNSAQNNLTGLSHWSYMYSVKPDDYFYQHLPGLDISVPEFIGQFQKKVKEVEISPDSCDLGGIKWL